MCFLKESYENMQKIQTLKILGAPTIQGQGKFGVCKHVLKLRIYTVHVGNNALMASSIIALGYTTVTPLKQNLRSHMVQFVLSGFCVMVTLRGVE